MTHITSKNNNSVIIQVLNIHIQTKKLNMNKILRTDQIIIIYSVKGLNNLVRGNITYAF